jgi:hypothetical protein
MNFIRMNHGMWRDFDVLWANTLSIVWLKNSSIKQISNTFGKSSLFSRLIKLAMLTGLLATWFYGFMDGNHTVQ